MRTNLAATGAVSELGRGDLHHVELDEPTGHRIIARRSGHLYQCHIAVAVNDRVEVELCEPTPHRGRLTRRLALHERAHGRVEDELTWALLVVAADHARRRARSQPTR